MGECAFFPQFILLTSGKKLQKLDTLNIEKKAKNSSEDFDMEECKKSERLGET